MPLDIVDIGEYLFSAAEILFDTADGMEEAVSDGSKAIALEIANLSPELEELRKAGCEALSDIIALVDLPLHDLEAAFVNTEIASYARAVRELEVRILARSRYKEDGKVSKNNSHEALEEFLNMLVDGSNKELEGEDRKLDPITFTFEKAQAAKDALTDAHKYVCKPSLIVAVGLKPVDKVKAISALCRDAGFLTADLAAACGGMAEPTGLVLFTSAKSVVTSSIRIKNTIDGLNISKSDQRKATRETSLSANEVFESEVRVFIRRKKLLKKSMRNKGLKALNGDQSDD